LVPGFAEGFFVPLFDVSLNEAKNFAEGFSLNIATFQRDCG